jgi:aldehyde dehydrogenase (NAD+)
MDIEPLMGQLGVEPQILQGGPLRVSTPIDGSLLAELTPHTAAEVDAACAAAQTAFMALRLMPAPKRGELIRLFGAELRAHKALLAELVSVEAGKIRQEALGEVQEMIDICDFALGLSRQLYGLTIA